MRIPKIIYESYPVLYVLMGITAISMVDSFVSFLSGFVLGAGGIAILFMRRNYRATRQEIAQLQ